MLSIIYKYSRCDFRNRKTAVRASAVHDPIDFGSRFTAVLGQYVDAEVDKIGALVATFLNLIATECSLIESYEADNYTLRNSSALSSW